MWAKQESRTMGNTKPNSGMKLVLEAIEKAIYSIASKDGYPLIELCDFTRDGQGFFELSFSGQTLLVEVRLRETE